MNVWSDFWSICWNRLVVASDGIGAPSMCAGCCWMVSAAKFSRAIEVTPLIHNQTGVGISPVRAPSERMEHCYLAGRSKFKDGPRAVSATPRGCSVQAAVGVEDYAPEGISSVCTPGENVKHGFLASRCYLENRAVVITSERGCAVEIAIRTEDQTRGISPVGTWRPIRTEGV